PQTVQTAEVYNAARNERRKMMLQAARNARIGLQFQAAAPQPMATDYGPGLTPAAAEELYGPGGMYGTTPLPGGLYAAQLPATRSIFNPGESASIGSQGVRQSTRQSTAAFPSDERLKSSSSSLTDAVKKIKKRVAIIRGTAALVGGDQKAADRYEAKALASLGIYAGQYALSQLTDADFQNKARFIQAANKSLMPFDMMTDLLPYIGPDSRGKPKHQEVVRLIGPDGIEFTGKIDYSAGEAKLLRMDGTPVASGTNLAPKTPLVDMGSGAETSFEKEIGKKRAAQNDFYEILAKDINEAAGRQRGATIALEMLDNQILETGPTAEMRLQVNRLLLDLFGPSDRKGAKDKYYELQGKVGSAEFFDVFTSLLKMKNLEMLPGQISNKELDLILSLGPGLVKSPAGNRILLKMMRQAALREMDEKRIAEEYTGEHGEGSKAARGWPRYRREHADWQKWRVDKDGFSQVLPKEEFELIKALVLGESLPIPSGWEQVGEVTDEKPLPAWLTAEGDMIEPMRSTDGKYYIVRDGKLWEWRRKKQ
ncbi:MAG: hypothetical protein QF732_03600, partial [Nitrospinaceae bacterium]|nr:hypothetical protein [Nitrospinaceae bacterium]